MNNNLHGIIYAFNASPAGLGELTARRTSASLPFGGRYRLIDFALSSMMNAGVRDVGVVMERDYQSLLDHIKSGKEWDMSRLRGGLRLLPPFGIPGSDMGVYQGGADALSSILPYLTAIPQDYVVLAPGNLCANIDLGEALCAHRQANADITAVCGDCDPDGPHYRFIPGVDGQAREMLLDQAGPGPGVASLEVYILSTRILIHYVRWCAERGRLHFHKDALNRFFADGGVMNLYMHRGFARRILTTGDYFKSSMELLDPKNREALFPPQRPVRTKGRPAVSTYYGEAAVSKNSLVADGCYIEGELENCIVSSGVRIEQGARLQNCIIMHNTVISKGAELASVIADKNVFVSPGVTLAGSRLLPLTIPKGSRI